MAVKIQTTANVEWTASANWPKAPTHVTIWFGANFFAESNALTLEVLENEEVYRLGGGEEITLNVTPANGAVNDADAALVSLITEARSDVTMNIRLHHADPGANHAGNELEAATYPGYARRSVGWTVSV